ncbi:MAG: UbiD family decarboxylase [Planctomycetes bacterium]|nr:UbiD family decarboxylase [Planctomycetota bacterium]
MSYRSLRQCIDDLAQTKQLVRIEAEVDPSLEAAEIHRRVYAAGGPAVFFANLRGTQFPMVSNLFGTIQRARYIFRDSLEGVRRLIELKADPQRAARQPFRYLAAVGTALAMRPRRVRSGPVLENQTQIDRLPQQKSWPLDGGAFITLPQVYTEDPKRPGLDRSNLGMYRIQLSGGRYVPNREIGLHYQIHRGIGIHHAAARERGEPLRVNVFVGGPPAMNLAAVMPLPEGLSELRFAGALMGRRVRMIDRGDGGLPIHADADFCICGTIDPDKLLPEGPFGDHLGYYSLAHDFPVLKVDHVYHRRDAIWPFTVVGRPPQEDTVFGQLIHELTGPLIPTVIPGVKAVHAVDAAGVHPLLLAIGSERYTPFAPLQRPQELLTQANAILGQGQLSLAKYLWISAANDNPQLDIHDIERFLTHILERVDWTRDLHFQTATTMDTLDYSGQRINEGSKLVIAAVGPPRRTLPTSIPDDLRLPDRWSEPRVALPGVLVVNGPAATAQAADLERDLEDRGASTIGGFPLVVVADDSSFSTASLSNFLWVAFTRSDPAADIYGTGAFVNRKHWGCHGTLVIDARRKPHHAPPLEPDPEITRRVDRLAERGGPLHGII